MLTDGTWYNDPTLLTSLSLSFGHPSFLTLSFVRSFVVSFPPVSVSRILSVRLPTAKATLGRNPNSVAKRLRRIAPTPFAFRLFSNAKYFAYRVLSRVCEGEKPQGLFPCLETISRFSCGKRCFKLSYIQSLDIPLNLYLNTFAVLYRSMYLCAFGDLTKNFSILLTSYHDTIDYGENYPLLLILSYRSRLQRLLILNI